eukprot:Polyplicarium_translucidae@DN1253_c0_g1_i2.p2
MTRMVPGFLLRLLPPCSFSSSTDARGVADDCRTAGSSSMPAAGRRRPLRLPPVWREGAPAVSLSGARPRLRGWSRLGGVVILPGPRGVRGNVWRSTLPLRGRGPKSVVLATSSHCRAQWTTPQIVRATATSAGARARPPPPHDDRDDTLRLWRDGRSVGLLVVLLSGHRSVSRLSLVILIKLLLLLHLIFVH